MKQQSDFLQITHPGEIPDIDNPEERILGDIVLGLPYIHKDCKTNSQKIEEVLPVSDRILYSLILYLY